MGVFDLIVVGGGAAGFYGAVQAADRRPGLKVLILEKTSKLLSKVRVSGGGRCNVTHACTNAAELSRHYPRGGKFLRPVFGRYAVAETLEWFLSRGVKVKAEDDGRMFPVTDRSETIIECLMSEARRLNVRIETGHAVQAIHQEAPGFRVITKEGAVFKCSKVLIAIGGAANGGAYDFIRSLGHTVRKPLPSLFTFNVPDRTFADLMGISVPEAEVRIAGTKLMNRGPLLITHWGLSGPAVIRLSAWAAEHLHDVRYDFTALVSWIGSVKEEGLRAFLLEQKVERSKQRIITNPLFGLPQRLWSRLCILAGIPEEKVWGEASHKQLNKLLESLIKCNFHVRGKTTFKEEFVTCGGVDLSEIDGNSLESKLVKGIYFAGEVLDIDGETGGFNFQAAWSTAFLAACSAASK